jgi:CheY-like chemotaxis protein
MRGSMQDTCKILLIDDRAERRELLLAVLRASVAAEITIPADPVSVGECLRGPSPDVIVLAHPSPWLPGFDLTRRVVAAFPGVPRVLLVDTHRVDAHAVAREITLCTVVSGDPRAALHVRDAVLAAMPPALVMECRTTIASRLPAEPEAPPRKSQRADSSATSMPALEGTLLRTIEPAALNPKVVELDSHRMRAMAAREEVEPTVRDEPEDRLQDILADLEAGSTVQLVSDDTDADCELLLEDVRATLGPVLRDTSGILSSGPLPVLPVPASQIAQVLQTLVSNGLKYRSSAPPRIHVRAERDGPRWQLQVEDNGRGVGAAARDRIFERFQRGRVGDSVPGTGIGLAVCKRIVEGHGGRIWVKPSSSGGSVFTFTVPLAERLPMQA